MKKVLIFLICMFISIPFNSISAENLNFGENAKSAILIEASTGEILFEKNSHERLVPASMTNVMETKL